jgi:hypothetical protein
MLPVGARATSDLWNVTTSGNWNLASNWTTGIPVAGQDVSITNPGTKTVTYINPGFTNAFSTLTLDNTTHGVNALLQNQNLLTALTQTVGAGGNGAYTLGSVGTNHVVTLILGSAAGGSGTYNLGGIGVLQISSLLDVGRNGAGTFNQSGFGSVSAPTASLVIGGAGAGVGVYNQLAGSLICGAVTLGETNSASGTFNQSGGVHTIQGALTLGDESTTAVGAYNMSNGATLTVNGPATFGNNGIGTFIQTGGSATFKDGLVMGFGSFSSGNVTLGGGTFSVSTNGGGVFVETLGAGTFNQSGGTHTVGGVLGIGNSAHYAMSNGATLSVGNQVSVGSAGGSGTFAQTGGVATADSLFSEGTVTFSGGTFTATTAIAAAVGGTIAQSGGTVNAGFLDLEGQNDTYNLSGGILSATAETIFASTFNHSGGVNSGGAVAVASSSYSMSNGAAFNASTLTIAYGVGSAAFNQTGGVTTINMTGGNPGLILGSNTGSVGSYSLSSGILSAPDAAEIIGSAGIGSYVQSGGTNTCFALSIGDAAGGSGTVTLSGGQINAITASVGNFGIGTMNQTGGTVTATSLYVGSYGTNGVSSYTMTNGTLAVSALSYVGYHAPGAFTQSGGSSSLGTLFVHFGSGGSGTVNLAGGSLSTGSIFNNGQINHAGGFLSAGSIVNNGQINQTGGFLSAGSMQNNGSFGQSGGSSVASLGAVSGSGTMTIGDISGAAGRVNVTRFDQSSITIIEPGTLVVATNAARFTNSVTNLQIIDNGTLDLGNHELLTNTNPGTIKTYLANAFDAGGNQDWSKPGLTSSVAKGNPTVFSVGYAYGGDQSAQDAGVTTHDGTPLAPNQTIVRAVLTGDANMDGKVDFFDITQILGYKYNTGQAASYTDGDLDYNGKVDFFDIVLLLSANYNSGQSYLGAHAASPTLTSAAAHIASSSGAMASATTIGVGGDGKPDFQYDPATGHLRFRTDGGIFTTTGGSSSFVSSLTISSASSILISAGASNPFATGTGATLTSTLLSSALTNTPGFSDGFDIGIILPIGLDAATLTADLTVKYQSLNGGALKTADITVPEASTLGLIGLAAASMMARKRRRQRQF